MFWKMVYKQSLIVVMFIMFKQLSNHFEYSMHDIACTCLFPCFIFCISICISEKQTKIFYLDVIHIIAWNCIFEKKKKHLQCSDHTLKWVQFRISLNFKWRNKRNEHFSDYAFMCCIFVHWPFSIGVGNLLRRKKW